MKNVVCMNCRGARLERFLDLGEQPNGNLFPAAADFAAEPRFPFAMAVCADCWQVQIEEFPPVEFLFSNHPYITGVNMPVLSHFDRMVADTLRKYPLRPNGLVLDIGANDGTLLKRFRDAGMRVIGIDPGKRTGELARAAGVTVCEAFWDEGAAEAFARLGLVPDLITATAVFYHVADIHSFVRGVAALLPPHGVFLTQCVYLRDVIEKLQFDHFYHEHTMIHAIEPLRRLFADHGLRMLDVEHYDVHGGSFVLYVGREDGPHPTSPSVERAIAAEREAGLREMRTYHDFARRVDANRAELVALLRDLRAQGKTIYALGAPLKGSTLLNYCGIGPDLVELATEVNRFKIGRFTPGTHIPILYEESVDRQPDYYLVLSWNFLDFFVEKYADYLGKGGRFIVPHPAVRVVGAERLGAPAPRAAK
jgi:SAM-dependent methyltransferase